MPPNILWIMTDQHRLDCLGAYADTPVRTPHLDRLANRSVVFDRHYTTCPLCVPARSSLHTGRYTHSCGAIINGFGSTRFRQDSVLNPDEVTLPEILAQAGYHVGHIGVDHVRAEPPLRERGCFATYTSKAEHTRYAEERGLCFPSMRPHQHECPTRVGDETRSMFYSSPVPGVHPFPVEDFLDVFYARKAAEFLEQAPQDRPFACLCFLWLPHPPFVIPEPYASMYSPADVTFPPNLPGTQEGKPRMHLRHLPGQVGAGRSLDEWRASWAAYWGCVTLVDECIGQVLAALEARGDADNTLIAFHPDHGEMLGVHSYFQKMVCYEESAHVPMMISGPGITPGRRSCLTSHVDLLPTFLDYAGVPVPSRVQGHSLRGVLEGKATGVREAAFSEYNGNAAPDLYQRCVVSGDHKYIWNAEDIDELYDLREDPYEMHNVAGDSAKQTLRRELRQRLSEWMRETGDFLELT